MPRVRTASIASWCVGALVAAGTWGTVACTIPDTTCIGRGTKTWYSGTLAIQTALDGATAVDAQGDGELIATDYDQDCLYDQEEFLIQIDECQLWMKLEPDASHPDASDPIPANVEPGQACTIHLSSGRARVSIASGRMTFSGGSPSFSLDAAIGSLDGKPAAGTVHVDFVAR
jgi:hypothetical protein